MTSTSGTPDDGGSRTGVSAYRVLAQVRPIYQASGRAVEQALQGTGLTVPLRAVLELVLDRGPMTVPQVAGEFGVTRQSVQALVDAGAARGLVELADNPRHRRSRLVAATEHGRQTFADVHARELAALDRVTADLDVEELARCARVLATLTDRIRQLPDHGQEPT
ncbi:MarR family winged helix-turn-helix transcriptional regulator [Modestobacter versicolor]|uniref:MarR family winged helix-turn-helix transcriptional regulator n=1 Tax=Modestobacter versicolor TaxID=429133 RepID=UPI0034DEC744